MVLPRLVALRLPAPDFVDALRIAWARDEVVLPLPLEDDVAAAALQQAFQPGRLAPGAGIALVVATSGSTGEPKGVVLSHRALRASVDASVRRLGAARGDVFCLALPLHHVAGIQVILRSWRCDTEPAIVDGGDVDALAEAPGDHISLVPTQIARLVERDADLSRWRSILVGGASLDDGLRRRAEDLGARVVTSYGMTETCGGCVYDGEPLDGVEMAIGDDGRVRLRGDVLFSGYLDGPPGATQWPREPRDPRQWLATSDLGEIDPDGRLRVLGRADDVIVTGGENVPAAAVADVLREHPGVADAHVLGMPDPDWGEVVVALVVPRETTVPPGAENLRALVRDRLPAAHAPRQILLVERIPRDAMGKVPRAALDTLVEASPREPL